MIRQILAYLYPQLPSKVGEKVGLLKDAAVRNHQDAEVWGLLGELLAPLDPAGKKERENCAAELGYASAKEMM